MSQIEDEKLYSKIVEAREEIRPGDKFSHYRDPSHNYTILALALDEEDKEVRVIYEDSHRQLIWDRKLRGENGFLTQVEIEGKTVPRFTKV